MARNYYRRSDGGFMGGRANFFDLPPFQLVFLISIVLFLVFFSWYLTYQSALEDTADQLKFLLMISPLLLLLLVRFLSSRRPVITLPRSEPDAIHRAGSSPWGVGLLVLILLVMVSHQSSFHEQWFPWRRD